MRESDLRLWRDLKQAEARAEEQRRKLAEATRELSLARQQEKSVQRHPDAVKYRHGADEAFHGFEWDDAEARAWLRNLPLSRYFAELAKAEMIDTMPVAQVELQAIRVAGQNYSGLGRSLILMREIARYENRHRQFLEWVAAHPDRQDWRGKGAKLRQTYLIERTAAALDIAPPLLKTRGDAHDWLSEHGANLRLRVQKASGHEVGNDPETLLQINSDLFDNEDEVS